MSPQPLTGSRTASRGRLADRREPHVEHDGGDLRAHLEHHGAPVVARQAQVALLGEDQAVLPLLRGRLGLPEGVDDLAHQRVALYVSHFSSVSYHPYICPLVPNICIYVCARGDNQRTVDANCTRRYKVVLAAARRLSNAALGRACVAAERNPRRGGHCAEARTTVSPMARLPLAPARQNRSQSSIPATVVL